MKHVYLKRVMRFLFLSLSPPPPLLSWCWDKWVPFAKRFLQMTHFLFIRLKATESPDMDWSLQSHKPKWPFPLLKLVALDILLPWQNVDWHGLCLPDKQRLEEVGIRCLDRKLTLLYLTDRDFGRQDYQSTILIWLEFPAKAFNSSHRGASKLWE